MSSGSRSEDDRVAAPLGDGVDEELRLLAAASGGTVVLFAWSGESVQCRLRVDPPPQPLVIPKMDCTAPLPGTEAALHVLLAWLPADVMERRLRRLDRAPFVVQPRALLAMRLARVRTAGHDVVAGGVRGEVTSIAAPVRDAEGEVTDALSLIAPSVYLEDLDLGAITADVARLATGLGAAAPLSPTAP